MQEAEDINQSPGLGSGALLAGIFVLLTVYVLAFGPAVKLQKKLPRRGSAVAQTIEIAYWPITRLSEHSRVVEKFIHWYVEDVWTA